MPRAFLVQSVGREFARHTAETDAVASAVQAATSAAGFHLVRADPITESGQILDSVFHELENADVVIVDVTRFEPNVMYESGFAHGAQRPTVVITGALSAMPFGVASMASMRALRYDLSAAGLDHFQGVLRASLNHLVRDPESWVRDGKPRPRAQGLFISYSHRDTEVLQRLLVHLRPLERIGVIDVWNDTRIEAGSDWQREVQSALDAAAAAVLIVSADFLASDFIVDNELPPLLERAASGGTLIVPLIAKSCRYARDPVLRRLQAINDPGRPLAALPESEQEAVFDAVAPAVERAFQAAA